METQGSQNNKNNPVNNKVIGIILPNFKTYFKASNQDSVALAQGQRYSR